MKRAGFFPGMAESIIIISLSEEIGRPNLILIIDKHSQDTRMCDEKT